jgi:hypothetical protein
MLCDLEATRKVGVAVSYHVVAATIEKLWQVSLPPVAGQWK